MRIATLVLVTGLTVGTAACGSGAGPDDQRASASESVTTPPQQTSAATAPDAEAPTSTAARHSDLPRTASPVPLILVAGVVALAAAGALRLAARMQ